MIWLSSRPASWSSRCSGPSLIDQRIEGVEGFLDRCNRVVAVDLIKIDVVGLETPQAVFDPSMMWPREAPTSLRPGPMRLNTLVARMTSLRAIFRFLRDWPSVFSLSPSE